MKISTKIIIFTFFSIVFAIILYGVIVVFTIRYSGEELFAFVKKLFLNCITLGSLATYIVYIFYRPISLTLEKIINKKEVKKEELESSLQRLNFITVFLFVVGVSSYFLGVVIQFLPPYLKGENVNSFEFINRLILGVSWGLVNGILTARIINFILIESKKYLNVYYIESLNVKKTNIVFKMMTSFFIFFIFIISVNVVLFRMSKINQSIDIGYIFIVNFLVLIFISIVSVILIIEVFSDLNYTNTQLSELVKDEVNLGKKIILTSFDLIGELDTKINRVIDKLSVTFDRINHSVMEVYGNSENLEKVLNNSNSKIDNVKLIISKSEDDVKKQIETIKKIISGFRTVIDSIETLIEENENQSKEIIETSSSLQEMIGSFQNIMNVTTRIKDDFIKLLNTVEESDKNIKIAFDSINEINNTTQNITKFITIISDISSKTNLLSMNASIEAAHAGESGKGFNVVAGEIRKLAINTGNSVKSITNLINEINDKVKSGINIFDNMKTLFDKLKKIAEEMKDIIENVNRDAIIQIENGNKNALKIDKLLKSSQHVRNNSNIVMENIKEMNKNLNLISEDLNNLDSNENIILNKVNEITSDLSFIGDISKNLIKSIKDLEIVVSKYKV